MANEQSMLQEYEEYLKGASGGFEEYKIGDEVTIGSESFYVIKDSPKTESKLLLLAKYNIIADKTNANYLTQSSSAGTVVFTTEGYWGNVTTTTDIVEPATIPESHKAAKAAYDYGVKVGGTGRLMTYSEAYALSNNSTFSSKLYETNFWLGSANNTSNVWVVDGDDSYLSIDDFGYVDYGVRPVVEISKSKVTAVAE